MIREDDVVTPTAGIEYLRQHGSGGRVLPLGVRLLPGNTMLRYGVRDVRGGDWTNVHDYEFLVSGRSGAYDFGKFLTDVPSSIKALNVSRVVVADTVRLPEGVQPVYDGEFRILDVNGLPRALLVHEVRFVPRDTDARDLIVNDRVDLRRTALLAGESPIAGDALPGGGPRAGDVVRITRESPNELALTVEADAPGYLIVNDTFFPGWRCEVDGSPRDITRANVAFRAVPIDAGPHEVVFRYRPWRALAGVTLAASTVIGIAAIGVARAMRARRRPRRETAT